MTRKQSLYMFSTDVLFSNILNAQLVEPADVEPMGMEGRL
jgi:hypothetical protein